MPKQFVEMTPFGWMVILSALDGAARLGTMFGDDFDEVEYEAIAEEVREQLKILDDK